jgi:hypothetical protein
MSNGNFVVDNEDYFQDRKRREERELPCGCVDRCRCDEHEDDDRFHKDYVEGK